MSKKKKPTLFNKPTEKLIKKAYKKLDKGKAKRGNKILLRAIKKM
tara:strand:+ start:618 stop:752 length:135 start_codon:yes stop_codon:yes gene_type:complete